MHKVFLKTERLKFPFMKIDECKCRLSYFEKSVFVLFTVNSRLRWCPVLNTCGSLILGSSCMFESSEKSLSINWSSGCCFSSSFSDRPGKMFSVTAFN